MEQLAYILGFMKKNVVLANGYLARTHNGRRKTEAMWNKLTRLLNSMKSGPVKSPHQWNKTWTDWKSKVRTRVSRGERPSRKPLGPHATAMDKLEMDLFSFITHDMYEPSGVQEVTPCTSLPPPSRISVCNRVVWESTPEPIREPCDAFTPLAEWDGQALNNQHFMSVINEHTETVAEDSAEASNSNFATAHPTEGVGVVISNDATLPRSVSDAAKHNVASTSTTDPCLSRRREEIAASSTPCSTNTGSQETSSIPHPSVRMNLLKRKRRLEAEERRVWLEERALRLQARRLQVARDQLAVQRDRVRIEERRTELYERLVNMVETVAQAAVAYLSAT